MSKDFIHSEEKEKSVAHDRVVYKWRHFPREGKEWNCTSLWRRVYGGNKSSEIISFMDIATRRHIFARTRTHI